jgi:hypothetical protein
MYIRPFKKKKKNKYVKKYTNDSKLYYIDKGVRIERMNKTGDIIVQNTMTNPEKFVMVTPQHYEVFENLGWEPGILRVNIDYIDSKLIKVNYQMKLALNNEEPIEKISANREKLLLKYFEYKKRFNKFVDLK